MSTSVEHADGPLLNAAELGAVAHLYRGEMYRSKIWRTRLDTTTNWGVATTGVALSVTFSSNESSPVPLALVGLLVMVFLVIEARRYRYFDIWRTRVRMMEIYFYGPILMGRGFQTDGGWNEALARGYEHLHFHISFWEAAGRRLRRNYGWIFAIQAISYVAKISIHPYPVRDLAEFWDHAAIGPVPGQAIVAFGVLFHLSLVLLAAFTIRDQHAAGRIERPKDYDDPMVKLGVH